MTEQKKRLESSETALARTPCLPAGRQEPKRTASSLPKNFISVLLIFAVAQVTLTPTKAAGQTLPETGASLIVPNLPTPPPPPGSDLKKSLAAAVARLKADTATATDFKRLEKEHDAQQVGAATQEKWTRKKKILVALVLVVMAGGLVVAIKHRCRSTPEKPCPEPDFSIYNDY